MLADVRISDWRIKVAHTRLPSVGFRSWSQSVSLQVTWIINPTVGCHYFPPGLQLPPQPLRGLLPILLLGEQRDNGCEQFAQDCYPTASWLRFEPGPVCAWFQHANHSATEPPRLTDKREKNTADGELLASFSWSLAHRTIVAAALRQSY